MATTDNIRNSIIDKLLTITNKDYLAALHKLIEVSTENEDVVKLTEEQKIILELSEDDIRNNRVVSQEQLDKDDLQWLRNL